MKFEKRTGTVLVSTNHANQDSSSILDVDLQEKV